MVRPTPPTIGQTEWGQPTLDAIEYATDTAEDALAGLAAKANTADVTTSLAGKANTSHTHAQSDITNLSTTLAGKSDTSHTHTYASITSKPAVVAAGADVAAARAAINIYELGPSDDDSSVPTGAIIIRRVV